MNIQTMISALSEHPETQILIQAIQPYLPVLAREGKSLYEDFISYAVEGKWTELDTLVWERMTESERNQLVDTVLCDARRAVDNQYVREKTAKEVAVKVASSILLSLLK